MPNRLDLLLGKPLRGGQSAVRGSSQYTFDRLEKKQRLGGRGPSLTNAKEEIITNDEGHLITIAPTGSGKGRNVIIPNLLSYEGPVVVIDPKGENYAVTARRRRAMGHDVICLDPFKTLVDVPGDSFNPLDIMRMVGFDSNDESRAMAELVIEGSSHQDKFWDNSARNLVSGLLVYLAAQEGDQLRSLTRLRSMLGALNISDDLQKLVDDNSINEIARQDIASVLALYYYEARQTFASVTSSAAQWVMPFGSKGISRSFTSTTFDLARIARGDRLSIFIVIPPSKLKSHRALLRMWVGSLLSLIGSRKKNVTEKTLFLIDEAAQLGALPILEQAITLLRTSGLKVWSFWQDLSQVKALYPDSWPTILNNCSVLQFFGSNTHMVVKDLSDITGVETADLFGIERDEQLLFVHGRGHRANKWDYLTDQRFATLHDPNPFY